jgi:hypothetical protein
MLAFASPAALSFAMPFSPSIVSSGEDQDVYLLVDQFGRRLGRLATAAFFNRIGHERSLVETTKLRRPTAKIKLGHLRMDCMTQIRPAEATERDDGN